jgi:hypothetical protein
MQKTNIFLFFFILILGLTACTNKKQFVVSGTISDASGQKLFLERDGLLKTITLDSCTLNAKGTFSFKEMRPPYPDFYRLRLKNASIFFAIDSCEHISIDADAKTMDSVYTVTGSPNSEKIKALRQSLFTLETTITRLLKTQTDANKAQVTVLLDSAIEKHKQLARSIVLMNPLSTAAYYAIFQQINGYFLFTPYNKDDRRYCAAVATAYNTFYPKSDRSISLYHYVMQAIVADQQARNQELLNQMVQHAKSGIIDLSLPDINGNIHKLSDLKGKVILLDYIVYQADNISDYIFSLRDLYSKFHAKGLEIYQVSLDKDDNVWRNAVVNLPWICVQGNGSTALSYNVTQVPTNFLIDRSGNLVKRNATNEDVQKAVDSK